MPNMTFYIGMNYLSIDESKLRWLLIKLNTS